MALKLLSGPALEPVSLREAKAHLRVDHADEDLAIAGFITSSRMQIEAVLDAALVRQQWRWTADSWPLNTVVEPALRPLLSVDAVRVRDAGGVATVLDPADYHVGAAGGPVRIVPASGHWPTPGTRRGGIEIDFTVGFGASAGDVPDDLRQALLLLTAHWFEHREPAAAGAGTAPVPDAISALIRPYRSVRL